MCKPTSFDLYLSRDRLRLGTWKISNQFSSTVKKTRVPQYLHPSREDLQSFRNRRC